MHVFKPCSNGFGSGQRNIIVSSPPQMRCGVSEWPIVPGNGALETVNHARDDQSIAFLIERRMEMVRHENVAETPNSESVAIILEYVKQILAIRIINKPLTANGGYGCNEVQAAGKCDSGMSSQHRRMPGRLRACRGEPKLFSMIRIIIANGTSEEPFSPTRSLTSRRQAHSLPRSPFIPAGSGDSVRRDL